LIQVTVENEQELKFLVDILSAEGLSFFAFHEPDLNNQITAVCIEPSPLTQKLIKKFPLL
jgi:hypothetical protein